MRNVLFVDDEPRILSGLKRMLRGQRNEWNMVFAEGGAAALEEMARSPFDIIVSDMKMPQMDGATLLEEVQKRHPATVRIVLSGHTDLAMAMRTVHVAHQFLSKPCESDTIREVVTRALNLTDLLSSPELVEKVGQIDSLPPIPRVYNKLCAALVDPDVTIEALASIVEQDGAISAKILQLVNSSFLSLARRVSTTNQAISYLGISMLKNLVLGVEVFRQFEGSRLPDWYHIDSEQEHAVLTAHLAGKLMPDRKAAENAYTAAMLHDMGRLVFAVKMPELYASVVAVDSRTDRPRCDVERETIGVSHADVGAYLLGIWGLPYPMVEAVAFHDRPSRVGQYEFDLLGAVHVADALAREAVTGAGSPSLDEEYVASANIAGRLPEWRQVALELAKEIGIDRAAPQVSGVGQE
ncbi:MAG: response regulator [Planctomycetota bacterium]